LLLFESFTNRLDSFVSLNQLLKLLYCLSVSLFSRLVSPGFIYKKFLLLYMKLKFSLWWSVPPLLGFKLLVN